MERGSVCGVADRAEPTRYLCGRWRSEEARARRGVQRGTPLVLRVLSGELARRERHGVRASARAEVECPWVMRLLVRAEQLRAARHVFLYRGEVSEKGIVLIGHHFKYDGAQISIPLLRAGKRVVQ